MDTTSHDLLTGYPLLATEQLGDAQEMTARFWPAHTSEVLGPDDYTLVMNRAVLGHLAVTYVRCSARVRVVPVEPSREARLIVPLHGDVEIETDQGMFRATSGRPLFQGAGWVRRFEASPSTCVLVDLTLDALEAAASEAGLSLPASIGCVSLEASHSKSLCQGLLQFIAWINSNARLKTIQRLSDVDRRPLLSAAAVKREHQFLGAVARALAFATTKEVASWSIVTAHSVELWLAEHAFSGLSLAELSRRAGTTTRAIQRLCEKAGFSPHEFIRGVQLDRARELLCLPSSATSVGGVAKAVCIQHQGRFSEYYRQRFGEQPSDTLARARRNTGGGKAAR